MVSRTWLISNTRTAFTLWRKYSTEAIWRSASKNLALHGWNSPYRKFCEPVSFGSVFSGVGGIDLGLERAGMQCRWQIEISPFCQKVLARHWPKVKRYGDIREVHGSELESVDLVCG